MTTERAPPTGVALAEANLIAAAEGHVPSAAALSVHIRFNLAGAVRIVCHTSPPVFSFDRIPTWGGRCEGSSWSHW